MKKIVLIITVLLFFILITGIISCSRSPASAPAAAGQSTFPDRPVNIIVGSGAGGGLDLFSRTMADPVSEILGVPIVVSNVVGGAGVTAWQRIMQLDSDGYNLYAISVDLTINDVMRKTDFTRDDLIPVMRAQMDQSMFWVASNSRFQTMQEVIDFARANPGRLMFGMVGAAGIDEVVIRHWADLQGVEVTPVPLASGSESLANLVGGHVDIIHEEPGPAIGFFQSGDIRPLLVLTEQRLAAFPDVPTARELGADITIGNWRGLFVRRDTPADRVEILQNAFRQGMDDDRYKRMANESLLDLRPGYASSEDFKVFLAEQHAIYYEILDGLGLVPR